MSIVAEEKLQQIVRTEPEVSKQIFDQYKRKKSLKKIAEELGMKYYKILQYSKKYYYTQRKKQFIAEQKEVRSHDYTHMKKEIKLAVCPECLGDQFYFDEVHHELSCKGCGLVITAPVNADFNPSGFGHILVKCNFKDIEVIVL